MLKIPVIAGWILLWSGIAAAQSPAPVAREAEFNTSADGNAVRFTPQFPPLQQIAGAPPAYYSCFWEFGDGSFSFEEKPLHRYTREGDYAAILDLTCNYDDGKKPRKKRKSVLTGGGGGSALAGVFDKSGQAIALQTNSQPRAGEELTCIVSYRNESKLNTDGRLHLFYNEKKYPGAHFRFDSARTYFGEMSDNAYTFVELPRAVPPADWVLFTHAFSGGAATARPADAAETADAGALLQQARGTYRAEQAWRFSQLRPGETRNLFAAFTCTPGMLKDTSALIHLEGIFEPFDPAMPAERFELEIEIVSSHDPNLIAVSDNRVNYRHLKRQQLDYQVKFQNNGEGPASTVQLQVEVPEGLNLARMRPVDWYPKCPICPKEPATGSCLDTASTRDGLSFTFRNIYLPGSRQKGVSDRDSTKGFVKYRIEPERHMPKRSFHSRAKIVFDKNPPIYTNFSKTRFKPGISPGLKAGYAFPPDAAADGYVFAGVSLSPYKSWRIYPQAELLTGFQGQKAVPELMYRDSVVKADASFKQVTYRDSTVGGQRSLLSFELPVLLRKNFSPWFGLGLGGSARVLRESGDDHTQVHVYRVFYAQPGTVAPPPVDIRDTSYTVNTAATRTRFAFFGDLTLGAVRAGPNLGIRAGAMLEERKASPFVQVSLEWKL